MKQLETYCCNKNHTGLDDCLLTQSTSEFSFLNKENILFLINVLYVKWKKKYIVTITKQDKFQTSLTQEFTSKASARWAISRLMEKEWFKENTTIPLFEEVTAFDNFEFIDEKESNILYLKQYTDYLKKMRKNTVNYLSKIPEAFRTKEIYEIAFSKIDGPYTFTDCVHALKEVAPLSKEIQELFKPISLTYFLPFIKVRWTTPQTLLNLIEYTSEEKYTILKDYPNLINYLDEEIPEELQLSILNKDLFFFKRIKNPTKRVSEYYLKLEEEKRLKEEKERLFAEKRLRDKDQHKYLFILENNSDIFSTEILKELNQLFFNSWSYIKVDNYNSSNLILELRSLKENAYQALYENKEFLDFLKNKNITFPKVNEVRICHKDNNSFITQRRVKSMTDLVSLTPLFIPLFRF